MGRIIWIKLNIWAAVYKVYELFYHKLQIFSLIQFDQY